MPQDAYEGFAERYDLFYGPFGEFDPTTVAFYRRLFTDHDVHSVLDCACGTGRHLPLFHSLGCKTVGSDISAAMLAQARRNLDDYGLNLPLHRVDFRELPSYFPPTFDAAMCLSSSMLHMPDDGQVLRALRSMHAVLRTSGILVLTQGTSDKQWAEKPRFLLAGGRESHTRLFVIDYLGEGARYHVLDIFHDDQGRRLETWSLEYPRIYLRDDQERLLKEAGFEHVKFYGSFDFDPYDKEGSIRLIAVAQKP